MKKAVSFLIAIQLTALLAAPAFAIDTIRSNYDAFSVTATSIQNEAAPFSDVPSSYWGYKTIMRAQELGLMNGVGDNKFNPEGSMTREQFITTAVRAIGKDSEAKGYQANAPEGSSWSYGYYKVAEKYGITQKGQFNKDKATRETPMTRAEMAYVVTNAMKFNGESAEKIVPMANIPDLNQCGSYMNAVQFAYSMGVLMGVSDDGTFNPNGTLTRAQAATVVVRMVDKDYRGTPDFEEHKQETPQGVQVFNEGSPHNPVKEGDIVIKADGTRVTLQATTLSNGQVIYGLFQGVDCITGTIPNPASGVQAKVGDNGWYQGDKTTFIKSAKTGEVFTAQQWNQIKKDCMPTGKGSYDGEERNTYFVWDEVFQDWVFER